MRVVKEGGSKIESKIRSFFVQFEMSETNNDMSWEETTEKFSKNALVEKLMEEITDAKDDCDADGYAVFELCLRGDKQKITDFITEVFEEWNSHNEIYDIHIDFSDDKPSYGTTDVWRFGFELSKPDDEDSWDNDFEYDNKETFCELVDPCELPSEPTKNKGKRPSVRPKNGSTQ